MPRLRRRTIARRQNEILEGDIFLLALGFAFHPTRAGRVVRACKMTPEQDEVMADVWNEIREWLLATWVEHNPATRPWAWWQWDAPERMRKQISGPQINFASALRFGVPTIATEALFETQLSYLDRHGLLEDSERRVNTESQVARAAFSRCRCLTNSLDSDWRNIEPIFAEFGA